jgi:hypothetical protein
MGFGKDLSFNGGCFHIEIQGDHGELSDRPFLSAPGGYYSPETYDWVDLAEPLERCLEGSFVVHEGEDIMQLGSGGALRAAAVIHGTETKMGRFSSIWLLNSLPWKDLPFLIGKAS